MSRTIKEEIFLTIKDMMSDLFYYHRKEDRDLPVGRIEEAVKNGEVSEDELVEFLVKEFKEALRD